MIILFEIMANFWFNSKNSNNIDNWSRVGEIQKTKMSICHSFCSNIFLVFVSPIKVSEKVNKQSNL